MFHVLTLATRCSCFLFVLGRSPPVWLHSMDTILRLLEGLRRDEIVWLNAYLTERLRAMSLPATAAATAQMSVHAGIAGDSVEEVPWMIGVRVQMQCRATNPLARRIERWSPNTCVCRPPRKTSQVVTWLNSSSACALCLLAQICHLVRSAG